jgi:hypothetical protein
LTVKFQTQVYFHEFAQVFDTMTQKLQAVTQIEFLVRCKIHLSMALVACTDGIIAVNQKHIIAQATKASTQ